MSCEENQGDGEDVYFQRGNGASPEIFVTVGTVEDLNGLKISADTIENTKRGAGHWKTYRKGLLDAGDFDIVIESIPGHTDWDTLESDVYTDRCTRNYRLVYPNNKTQQIAAVAKDFEQMQGIGESIKAKVGFKGSGMPTWV